MRRKPKIRFHVCVPLYHGVPKELQTGWVRYDAVGVESWDNTTPIAAMELQDLNLYCGTCGRLMVKGRKPDESPPITAHLELL